MGMTTRDIAARTQVPEVSIRKALATMPEVYIDRWTQPKRGQYRAVWCVCVPPENCPHPNDKVVVKTMWQKLPQLPVL